VSKVNAVLVVVIVVLIAMIVRAGQKNKASAALNHKAQAEFLVENAKRDNVLETGSGLQYEVLVAVDEEGAKPRASSKVKVHYHGTLIDGSVFDSSVERNQPISFGLNQVISGWTEGVQLMKEGEKFRFYIPSELGYGDKAAGRIPPGSLLIFEVELLKIES
jgi:peptidylprolyl isomerase